MKKRFLISVSGGRSSVALSKLLKDKENLQEVDMGTYVMYVSDTMEVVFVFANATRERWQTLAFMNNMSIYWGIKVTWVEAIVHHDSRTASTHKIVDYTSAKLDGSVFEEVIKKYGLPNKSFPHCTRELKMNPIRSFMKSIGWGSWKDYVTIIGYRADEPKRANLIKAQKLNQWYPLFDWGIKKSDIAFFWNRQPFDLGLIDAEGNCEDCYKKSDGKILYQYYKQPEGSDWIIDMQNKYRYHSAGRTTCKSPFTMFRGNRELQDIIDAYPEYKNNPDAFRKIFDTLNDKSLQESGSDFDFFEQEDCSESCEAFTEEESEYDFVDHNYLEQQDVDSRDTD